MPSFTPETPFTAAVRALAGEDVNRLQHEVPKNLEALRAEFLRGLNDEASASTQPATTVSSSSFSSKEIAMTTATNTATAASFAVAAINGSTLLGFFISDDKDLTKTVRKAATFESRRAARASAKTCMESWELPEGARFVAVPADLEEVKTMLAEKNEAQSARAAAREERRAARAEAREARKAERAANRPARQPRAANTEGEATDLLHTMNRVDAQIARLTARKAEAAAALQAFVEAEGEQTVVIRGKSFTVSLETAVVPKLNARKLTKFANDHLIDAAELCNEDGTRNVSKIRALCKTHGVDINTLKTNKRVTQMVIADGE